MRKPTNDMRFLGKVRRERPTFFGAWARLLRACRPHALAICFSVLLAIGAAVLTIAAPAKLAELTDLISKGLTNGISIAALTRLSLVLLVLYLGAALCSALTRWMMSGLTQHVSHHIRLHVFEKINRMSVRDCENAATGDVLSRTIHDVDMVGHALHETLSELVPALILLLASLFMMCVTNLALTLVALASVLLGFGGMLLIMRRSQKHFDRQQQHLGDLAAHVEEIYTAHETVRACGGEQTVRDTFVRLNHALAKSSFLSRFMAGLLSPLLTFMANCGYLAVCVVGALLVMKGNISFGVIVAFVFFVHHFTHPLAEIANVMQAVQSAASAGERVYEFLEGREVDESEKTAHLATVKGEVTFSHVTFRYPESERPILRDVSLTVPVGTHVALLGKEGSGKTTLAHLLAGFYFPDEGEILLDGVATRDLPREDVHAGIACALQAPWIFEGTVRENLTYCAKETSHRELREICERVGLDEYILTLPRGYDTVLEHGVHLPDARRQQIGIVRALLQERPILIFDEAMTALDPATEANVVHALRDMTRGRTTFFVAHRPLSVKHADLIVVMEDGHITEKGTHAELMEKEGYYAALCRAAFH